MQNIVFEGAAAASCRIQLANEPGPDLLQSIRAGNTDIIGLESMKLGE